MSNTTYTLAFLNDMIMGTGRNIKELQKNVENEISENNLMNADESAVRFDQMKIVENVTLTDIEPENPDHIIFESGNEGWIMDENDDLYAYAVVID